MLRAATNAFVPSYLSSFRVYCRTVVSPTSTERVGDFACWQVAGGHDMLRFWPAATTALAMLTGAAVAQTSAPVGPVAPQPPGVAEPIMTVAPPIVLNGRPSEPAIVAGSESSTATTAVSGSSRQGISTDDGNASGMIVPGQPPKLVSTPE